MTAPVCACGHGTLEHQSDPAGNGNTPCWHGDGEDSYGYPISRCRCGEYNPEVTDTG